MKIDLITSQHNNQGGRSNPAAYGTKIMRVPIPLAALIKELTLLYTQHGIICETSDMFGDNVVFETTLYKEAISDAIAKK